MKAKSSGREERLAAALRENLKRRKARDRKRVAAISSEPPAARDARPNKAAKTD